MKETPTGLADLARAFKVLNPARSECAAIARLLGLKGDIVFGSGSAVPQPDHQVIMSTATNPAAIAIVPEREADDRLPRVPRVPARLRGWQYEPRVEPPGPDVISLPTKLTELRPPPVGDMPSYVADAEELDFQWGIHRHLPTADPLVPQGQLRALIAHLIIVPVPGGPDISQLVEALARGRLPKVLPREKRKGMARRLHVLLDTADSMRLFRRDAVELIKALRDVAGPAIQSEEVTYGPPSTASRSRGAHGDTVLIISDFGIGSRPLIKQLQLDGWRKFSVSQHRRGLHLTAVVPFHYQRWPASLKRRIRMVHWHRPGSAAIPAGPLQLRRLARVLSLAAVIDPALLRLARMYVLPAADAGAEADFANGPWTAVWNPRVIALFPRWIVALRSELAQDPALLEAAHRLLERERPRTSDWDRVLFEEHIVYLSLQSASDSPEHLKNALARVIRSLFGRMRNPTSARWALCFIEELPESAQKTEAAQVLKAVASIILNTSHVEVAEIVVAQNARWVFHRNFRVGVVWTGSHILVREPPLSGDRVMEVPDTWPRVVIVADLDRPRKKVLHVFKRKPPAWTRATFLPRLLTTAAGAEYRLDDAREIWATLLRAFEAKQTLTGVVKAMSPEGYHVDIGLDAFLFERQLLLEGHNIDDLIGSTVEVTITSFKQETQRIEVALASHHPVTPLPLELWQEIEKRFDARETVSGLVTAVGHSGCAVSVLGVTRYVSFGELQASEKGATQELIGKTLDFCIVAIYTEMHEFRLSRKFEEFDSWKKLLDAMKAKTSIPGKVQEAVTGGYVVDIGMKRTYRAFVPASQIDGTVNLDHSYDFHVLKLDWKRQNVVLSRRGLSEQALAERRDKLLSKIIPGDTLKGTVKSIVDYGAFVDLNGIDGLLHMTEIGWRRIKHPSDVLKVGQVLDVFVLDVSKEKLRVNLSLKQLMTNPWDNIEMKYPVGTRLKRNVVKVVDYGVFIELEPGIEGLIHTSEFSWTHTPAKASKVFKEGDEVEAVMLDVDKARRRISLSIKQLMADPWDTVDTRYPIGMRVRGSVTKLTVFGAFVELEPFIEGLVHLSDISETQVISDASEVLKEGDQVEAVVLTVDKVKHRIALGIKQLAQNR